MVTRKALMKALHWKHNYKIIMSGGRHVVPFAVPLRLVGATEVRLLMPTMKSLLFSYLHWKTSNSGKWWLPYAAVKDCPGSLIWAQYFTSLYRDKVNKRKCASHWAIFLWCYVGWNASALLQAFHYAQRVHLHRLPMMVCMQGLVPLSISLSVVYHRS